MAFTLRQLQFFVAAAQAGSVTGAARELSISQSGLPPEKWSSLRYGFLAIW
ncbi:MAG: LysR family transcriptional regulator, partial [Paracoccaceae bacterium]